LSSHEDPLDLDEKKKRKKVSKAQKQKIAKGQDWICDKCKKKFELFTFDIHHRDGDSSNNLIGNLAAWCVKCHREETQKHNREKDTRTL
jgi:hypothetical protein